MRANARIVLVLAAATVLGTCLARGQFPWTKDARNPVLSGGQSGTWNRHVFNPCVLYNADSARYEMWFGAALSSDAGRPFRVGFATSPDGIAWSMHPTAVLAPDSGRWDAITVEAQEVIRENRLYKMWYAGWNNPTAPSFIGYATSPDGIHWTKHPGNPVFAPGTAAWEAGGPYGCTVMPVSGGYKLWYSAYDATFASTRIGYATSADGIAWVRDTLRNPVLSAGAAGQWDSSGVAFPEVLRINNMYHMWYGSGARSTGIAVSADGVTNWIRHASNPVLTAGPAGSWDQHYAGAPSVLLREGMFRMWYDGGRTPTETYLFRIGHATAPILGVAEQQDGVPASFTLGQNYPNPFNPTTSIGFSVVGAREVTLAVYDLLGREVAVLVNEKLGTGNYTVRFDAGNLASGAYVYRLQAGDFMQTRHMLLIR